MEIFEAFKEVAKEMNITFGYDFELSGEIVPLERRKPLMTTVAGDLIAVVIPTTDLSGNSVNFEEYLRRVQARVVEKYSDRPFQDYMKVEVPNGIGVDVVRLPLWENTNETDPEKRFLASKTQPEGYEPYMRTVSITVLGKTIRIPRNKLAVSNFIKLIDRMSEKLDDLKVETSPVKNAIKMLPTRSSTRRVVGVEFTGSENVVEGEISDVNRRRRRRMGMANSGVSAATRIVSNTSMTNVSASASPKLTITTDITVKK